MTPEYLNENWTEELLVLMFKARAERLTPSEETAKGSKPVEAASTEAFLQNMNGFGGGGFGYERR